MRIVIVGLGDIGRELAEDLGHHGSNELVLIDLDEKRCQELSGRLDALVLHGDGANPEVLKRAEIERADALVATTASDAINTVIVMLGSRFGVKRMIVKLNDTGLRAACEEIGVEKIIAPKISAVAEIVGVLYGFNRLDFSLVIRRGMRLVEFAAQAVVGQRLSEVEIPDGAVVVAVLRGEEVLGPRRGVKLGSGDRLLVLVEDVEVEKRVRQVLEPAAPNAKR